MRSLAVIQLTVPLGFCCMPETSHSGVPTSQYCSACLHQTACKLEAAEHFVLASQLLCHAQQNLSQKPLQAARSDSLMRMPAEHPSACTQSVSSAGGSAARACAPADV